jgi:hypothetical protein
MESEVKSAKGKERIGSAKEAEEKTFSVRRSEQERRGCRWCRLPKVDRWGFN